MVNTVNAVVNFFYPKSGIFERQSTNLLVVHIFVLAFNTVTAKDKTNLDINTSVWTLFKLQTLCLILRQQITNFLLLKQQQKRPSMQWTKPSSSYLLFLLFKNAVPDINNTLWTGSLKLLHAYCQTSPYHIFLKIDVILVHRDCCYCVP